MDSLNNYFKNKFHTLKRIMLIDDSIFITFFLLGVISGILIPLSFLLGTFLLTMLLVFLKSKLNLFLVLIFVLCGAIFSLNYTNNVKSFIEKYQDQKIYSLAEVSEITYRNDFSQKAILFLQSINSFAVISLPRYPELNIGDKLEIGGELKIPKNTSKNFNYTEYLKSKKVYFELNKIKQISYLTKEKTDTDFFVDLKARINETLTQKLKTSENGLVAGILIGEKNNLPVELENDLKNTGLFHIISVSGFNFIFLFSLISGLCGIIHKKYVLLISFISIFIYLNIVGVQNIPATRATIMISILIIGSVIGRRSFSVISMYFAAFLFLTNHPFYIFNISLILTFCATLGLLFLSSFFKKIISKTLPHIFNEIIVSTLSVMTFSAPVLILVFKNFPIISIFTNLLIVPFIPILMILGFWGVVSNLINLNFIEELIFNVTQLLAEAATKLIHFASQFSNLNPNNSLVGLIIFFLMLTVFLFYDFKIFIKNYQ